MNIFSGWLIGEISHWFIEIIIGTSAVILLSFLMGKKPISQSKVEELKFLIRSRAVIFSWSGLMLILVFALFDALFNPKFVNSSKWDPIFYILISLFLYVIGYIINKRKYL